jgi:hypothetical protein
VDIDVEQGAINLKSNGVIPVAILTTPAFDASQVDPSTVEFEGAAPDHKAVFADVDDDGDKDLLLKFRTQETDLVPGQTEACLRGHTFSGTPIHGCDTVRVLGKPIGLLGLVERIFDLAAGLIE